MIWENSSQGLSYVIEFEWHHSAIRLLHTQDIESLSGEFFLFEAWEKLGPVYLLENASNQVSTPEKDLVYDLYNLWERKLKNLNHVQS